MEVMNLMEVAKMGKLTKAELAAQDKWKKKNTTMIGMRLQNTTDADIIEAIMNSSSKQGEIKRLVRLGLEYERILNEQKTE